MFCCSICKKLKKPEDFPKEKAKVYSSRKDVKDRTRDKDLQRTFGVTLDEYNRILSSQNGNCAICGIHNTLSKKALCLDHCHYTGKIRGILCLSCNSGIGYFKDKVGLVYKALLYLEKHK